MRTVIKYSRTGNARYISHLDMQRAFSRALRRCGLPVAYSEGYNPHIIMSFASPLSVGYATEGDYLEVRLDREVPPEEIRRSLGGVMPDDIRILSAGRLPDTCKKLMSLNARAEYRVEFGRDIGKEAEALFSKESITVTDRKGREKDIKPMVIAYRCEGDCLFLTLDNSSEKSLNPSLVIGALGEDAGSVSVTRLECYARSGEDTVPFSELAENKSF